MESIELRTCADGSVSAVDHGLVVGRVVAFLWALVVALPRLFLCRFGDSGVVRGGGGSCLLVALKCFLALALGEVCGGLHVSGTRCLLRCLVHLLFRLVQLVLRSVDRLLREKRVDGLEAEAGCEGASKYAEGNLPSTDFFGVHTPIVSR